MIYVFLADGFEEIEAIATIDVMLRASLPVTTVGVGGKTVRGTHGITVVADAEDKDVTFDDITGVVLPGGMPGTTNLAKSETVAAALASADRKKCLIAAICAAPSILGQSGLLKGRRATCFDGFEDKLDGADVCRDYVCTDDNIITGRGAGAAVSFGLEIVKYFKGAEYADSLANNMKCP